jgi:hypothetical protein
MGDNQVLRCRVIQGISLPLRNVTNSWHHVDGYCKQEDWESLIQRFPADAQKKVLQLFAQTLWTKHLFEDVFLKPFLYFDFYEQEEMTSTAGKPDISLPTNLQNMYHMFRTGTVSHLLQSKLTDRNVPSR